ncbi:MAG: TetR/AcrR family transcriptional regulator [Novosphingobium sp.]|nr:TetR/AcrR family transcriptional regulator [Novosphingobium sp.]MCP5400889.1 TetR/AcrR family transcriptional regulator [Novosphingobium sp.]
MKSNSGDKLRMTQAERTALSDARMLEAATELIVEHGTHNTTLREVGERAGYSRGLASNRFGSKEGLFSQLVRDFNRRWADELRKQVGDSTGLPAFSAALDAVEYFLLNRSNEMKALYIVWFESMSSHDEVRKRLARNHTAYRRDAERWVREGIRAGSIRDTIDPQCFAVEFASLIFGLIYQWLVDPDKIDVHAVFQHYRKNAIETLAVR